MKNLLRRLKNLYLLSDFRPMALGEERREGDIISPLIRIKKDFPTIKHKLATIIQDEKEDLFQENGENTEQIS